jgi:hypothetical protein
MAELLPLEQAASAIGKSTTTVRRLVKANKIPFEKQRTPTGFIYLLDTDNLKAYYQARDGSIFDEDFPIEAPAKAGQQVRIAVAGETGGQAEYWQKKAELYEDKYLNELTGHAQTREDLGVWRGRAEQAQSMLLKLLPNPQEVEVRDAVEQKVVKAAPKQSPMNSMAGMLGLISVLVVIAVVVFLKLWTNA